MNENINLAEILRGHEGETFYSPMFGECKLIKISEKTYPIELLLCSTSGKWYFSKEGKYVISEESECILFPSKEQRDWKAWFDEQIRLGKQKEPKTWSQFIVENPCTQCRLVFGKGDSCTITKGHIPIEKSALALIKIYILIEYCYGGNPTHEEKYSNSECTFVIDYDDSTRSFIAIAGYKQTEMVAFHTEEQAKEFLSYKENIQLLKDYYMI